MDVAVGVIDVTATGGATGQQSLAALKSDMDDTLAM